LRRAAAWITSGWGNGDADDGLVLKVVLMRD
jgi:hypothetical protein